jgi:hypothetical protein
MAIDQIGAHACQKKMQPLRRRQPHAAPTSCVTLIGIEWESATKPMGEQRGDFFPRVWLAQPCFPVLLQRV